MLRIAQFCDQRRGHDGDDDKNHLKRVEHPGAQRHPQQYQRGGGERRQGRGEHGTCNPAVGAQQPKHQAEGAGTHQQRKQRAAQGQRVGQHAAQSPPVQGARGQRHRHQQHTAGGRRFNREKLACEHATQQQQNHAGYYYKYSYMCLFDRGYRHISMVFSTLPARQQRPQQQNGQGRQQGRVENVPRVDDALRAQHKAGQVAGFEVRAQHGVTQQNQHQRRRHHHANGGGHADQRRGARGIEPAQTRGHQARQQGGAGRDRAVHRRNQRTYAQSRQRVTRTRAPEQVGQRRKHRIRHREALQQHAHQHVQRQCLQQIMLQQAHHAGWQHGQHVQVDHPCSQAQRGKQAGRANQQSPYRQACGHNQHAQGQQHPQASCASHARQARRGTDHIHEGRRGLGAAGVLACRPGLGRRRNSASSSTSANIRPSASLMRKNPGVSVSPNFSKPLSDASI